MMNGVYMTNLNWGDAHDESKQAQETEYRGVRYRSKLEAKTAQTLDNFGIGYKYEPEGYQLSNGLWYKPDFLLPDADEFIECKGVMENKDVAKIVGLVKDTGCPVLAISYENSMLIAVNDKDPENEFIVFTGNEIKLMKCRRCGTRYFVGRHDMLFDDDVFSHIECPHCGVPGIHADTVKEIENGQAFFDMGQDEVADTPFYANLASVFNS